MAAGQTGIARGEVGEVGGGAKVMGDRHRRRRGAGGDDRTKGARGGA